MGPEKRTARLIIGSLGRIFCVGLGVFCIWNQLIPVYGKDFPELLNYGSKGLIIKKATVDSVDLGVRGSGWLGMFIHFVGEGPKNDHDYPFSFYQPRIHEGSTWNFLMLENSGIVLEVREQGQKFDL